jgi:ABC-type uncharacterized transport system ATPase component
MRKHVLKSDQEGQQTLQILLAASSSISKFIQQNADTTEDKMGQRLTATATQTIWVKVLSLVFSDKRASQLLATDEHAAALDHLMQHVFVILKLHKNDSLAYLTKVGAVRTELDDTK